MIPEAMDLANYIEMLDQRARNIARSQVTNSMWAPRPKPFTNPAIEFERMANGEEGSSDITSKSTRTQLPPLPSPSEAEILQFFAEPPPNGPRHPRTGTPAEPDAQILGRFIFKCLSTVFDAPHKAHRGVCLLCTQVVPDISSHLLGFGPHGELWSRAIVVDEGLTFLEWCRLVLFIFANMAAVGDERITYDQLHAVRWLWTVQDNLLWFEFAEPASEPRYVMPLPKARYLQREGKCSTPGLEFVLPFAERIREWASKTSERLEQARARMQAQSYGMEGLRM